MTDNLNQNSVHQQKQTTASLANLTDDDVVKIWDSVSTYIESLMKQCKGVIIPGFGTFSFIQKRIDVGNNKHLLIQRPVFALSEKVIQTHGLVTTRYPINGSIPVHPLNFFQMQTQSTYSRDQIEQCVKHVLQVFNRSIAAQRNVEFTFARIGKLQIRSGKVKMRFFKEFIQSVDETSGKNVIEVMCNRPQTSDSVMTNAETARPGTSTNVVLPRLNSRIGNSSMQSIEEENSNEDRQEPTTNSDDLKLPTLVETNEEISANSVKTTGTTQENFIPIASVFSSTDIFPIKPGTANKKPPNNVETTLRRSFSVLSHEPTNSNPSGNKSALGLTRPVVERVSSSLNLYSQRPTATLEKAQTSCGHYGTGQELCHLCSQRAKRNIPVYLHEEKRIRDETEEKLLQDFRQNRDLEEQKQQELKKKAAREERQQMATYNLMVAEARRAQKAERTNPNEIPRSIIFRRRARTPPNFIRQQDFSRQIEAQIKAKKDEQRAEKQDRDFVERLEQIQLAQSLAQERESYFKNKRLHQEALRKSLDDQIRNKPAEIPGAEIETAYFGLHDTTNEQLKQRRAEAIELFRQQKETTEQRQRENLLRQIREQEQDIETLNSMKQDLLTDRQERYRRALKIRKDLEADWTRAAQEKHARDEEQRQEIYGPDGALLHEQCDKYKRCGQCQRNLENRGESTCWKDTRFVAGTHIIV